MFADGKSANKEVILLDIGRHAGHAFANPTSIHPDITLDLKTPTVAVSQDIEKCCFSCSTEMLIL